MARSKQRTSVVWCCFSLLFLAPATRAQEKGKGLGGGAVEDESDASIQDLRRRLEAIERQLRDMQESSPESARPEVDLSDESVSPGALEAPSHVLARPWYQNLSLWGYGAADYIRTGDAALRPEGGFLIREAAIFIEAEVMENASFLFEIRSDYKGFNSFNVTTGEVYAHFRDVLRRWGNGLLGIKVGRFDVPFGEEYLYEQPPDNPLITNSAHWLYGTDEGIQFYGKLHGLGWVVAVMDGSASRNIDDDSDKAVSVKLHGMPRDSLYLSASFMRNGSSGRSAVRFGGSDFQPVGNTDPSTLGISPSKKVNALLYALDARWTALDRAHIALSFGQAFVDDREPGFDRDFLWFSVEALYHVTPRIYGAIRYSEIGTYDPDRGYHHDGTFTAGGNASLGYDVKRFQRLAVGAGWRPHPNVLLKVEGGTDRYEVIRASDFDPHNGQRWFAGAELVLSF